jgi:hypothetical protein
MSATWTPTAGDVADSDQHHARAVDLLRKARDIAWIVTVVDADAGEIVTLSGGDPDCPKTLSGMHLHNLRQSASVLEKLEQLDAMRAALRRLENGDD